MKILKIILFCSSFIFSACNSNSRSTDPNAQIRKVDPNRACVPEDELLAGNIVGGELVAPGDSDSKVVLMVVSGGQLCTGAAIAKNVILTAAHCIAGNKQTSAVIFYPSRSCESGFNKHKYTQAVKELIVHEDYDANAPADKMKGDIALVVLEKDIPEGYVIHQIANPAKMVSGTDIYLYGYGRISGKPDSRLGSGMLRKTSLPREAFKISTENKKVQIDQSSGTGMCQGDSGGPSFVEVNTEGGTEKQILGVNSYVSGPANDLCSDKGYETLVHSYVQWIELKLSPL